MSKLCTFCQTCNTEESPKDRDHSEDQSIDGRMGSDWILGKLAVRGGGGGYGLD
jgi:hypothetical protein